MHRRTFGSAATASPALVAAQQSRPASRTSMRFRLLSVFVDDQEKALQFYTETLGFLKKREIPVGSAKWLTVVAPDEPGGMELLLEPPGHPAAKAYQKALFADGIALAAFAVPGVQKEYERLKALGVEFKTAPVKQGTSTIAVFADTCGNYIQIFEA